MKLEVGKKYVDGRNRIYFIVGRSHEGHYEGELLVNNKIVTFIDSGIRVESNNAEFDLVKEHAEPRTKDVWVVWNHRTGDIKAWKHSTNHSIDGHTIKKVTLTEGEYDE